MPIPTARALIVLLGAAPLLIISQFVPPVFYVAIIYVLLALALLAYDYLSAPRPDEFEAHRICESKLSIAANNAVTLHLAYRPRNPNDNRAVSYVLRDEPPFQFVLTAADKMAGTVRRGEAADNTYQALPHRRGDYRFGNINLRWLTPLGLLLRQAVVPAAQDVKVYPNLLEVRKYELLARRNQLYELGLKNVRRLGVGSEFERLREYNTDDDFRRIYWPATARQHRPIVMDYETERSQTVIVALDAGRLMSSPIGPLAKLDYAVNTALLLSYIATLRGDRVGILAFADKVLAYLAPDRGRKQFITTLDTLYNIQPQSTEPDYADALSYLALKFRRRALVVLFTDLVDTDASTALVRHVSRMVPRYLPVTVTMSNAPVVAAATHEPQTSAQVYEQVVAQKLLQERREVLEILGRNGVLTIDVPADKLNVSVINKYLELKARGAI
jgi:uncharacterized protein (DUF58 family)